LKRRRKERREEREEKGREKRRGKKRGRCAIYSSRLLLLQGAMGREKRQAIGTQHATQPPGAARSPAIIRRKSLSPSRPSAWIQQGKKRLSNAKPGTATSQADISRFSSASPVSL